MKYALAGLLAVIVVAGGVYLVMNWDSFGKTTYTNSELEFSFKYKGGDSGYVLQEAKAPDDNRTDFVTNIQLTDADELREFTESTSAREGPPTIGIMVFKNSSNFFPREWMLENPAYSNVGLMRGDIVETEIAGAKAVRYTVDGLYLLDTVIVASGNYIYVFTAALLGDDTQIADDFDPLLDSVSFGE